LTEGNQKLRYFLYLVFFEELDPEAFEARSPTKMVVKLEA